MAEKKKKYKAKYSGKLYNTKYDAMVDNRNYLLDPSYRFEVKAQNMPSYKDIEIPYIPEKAVTLNNAGLATGAHLSTNLLDTIAKYAELAGLPILTALGLATKESTLGNPTDDKTFSTLFAPGTSDREYFENLYNTYGAQLHINNGNSVSSKELINMHDSPNPYYDALAEANRLADKGKDFNLVLLGGEQYADNLAKRIILSIVDLNALLAGFNKYKNNPSQYNPGLSNYQLLVNQRGREVWLSPEIQLWWKEYNLLKNYYPDNEDTTVKSKANGGELDKPLEWNDLSMTDRAAYIRMGVANGYKDIDSIKEVYNEFREGGNLYHKGGKKQYVYDVLPSLLKKAGVDVRVTSGYRPNGAVGTAKFSHHSTNNAVDIVSTGKSTWDDIRNALYNDPEIKSYMLANGYGLLDETGSTIRKKTGATGAHFHIGKDSKPALAYRNRVGALLQTGDNKVVYFTNPFMPIPEDNPKVVASTTIPPLATPTITNILLPVEKLDNIAVQLTLPEVVVTPDEPRNRFFSFTPQDLMNQMLSTITPYEPIVLPKPTTASERLAQNSQETASFLLKDLEDSILRNTLLGNYDLDKLRRDLKDLLFYRNMNNIDAYGGNLYTLGGIAPIMNAPAALKKAWNAAKKRLYRTVTPEGYHIPKATMEFIKGDTRDYNAVNPADNEVWAKYLLVPYDKETNFEPAIYRPTMGTATYDDVIKLKDESLILSNDILRLMLNHLKQTGKNTMLIEGNERGLGTYTVSLGEDENGKYISYYDDWDLNPFRGISAALNVPALSKYGDIVPGSHPFTVYGRRYYTDADLLKALGGPLVDRALNIYDGTSQPTQQMSIVPSWDSQRPFYEELADFNNQKALELKNKLETNGITVTKKREKKKPYWVSPKGAGNTALTADDLSKAYTAATVGLLPNPISAGINLSQGKVLNALEDMWLYNSAHSEDPNVNYGVVGFSAPEGSLFGSVSKAAKATPEQWTAAQDAAIARGDMAEAQRLRDLHFKVNTSENRLVDAEGNPVKMIHGSQAKFTEFKHKDNPYGMHGRGMYFGIAPESGTTNYGGDNGYKYLTYLNGKGIYPDFGIIQRDNTGKVIPNDLMYEIIGTNSYDEFINSVTNQFKDKFDQLYPHIYDVKNIEKTIDKGLYQKIHDTFDTKVMGADIHKKKHWFKKDEKYATFNPQTAEEIVVRDPNQIKLADAVTYNKGVRIPLGDRDNFKLNDIRWAGSAKEDYSNSEYGLLDYLRDDKINAFLEGKPFYESDLGPLGVRRESFPSDWTMTKMPFSDESKEIINNSAKPRILAQAEKDIRDVYDPTIDGPDIEKYVKDELSYIEKQLDEKINEGYELGSDALFKAHDEGKTATRTGGLQLTNNGKIVLREGENPEEFAVHEWEHRRTNSNIGGSHYGNEKRLLRKAFTKEFRELSETVPDFKGMNMDDEMVTTVSDTREALIGKTHLRKTAPELQNKMIDKSSDEKVFKAVEKANAYGFFYIQKMRELGKLTPELAQNIREALKYVGAYAAPIGIGLGTAGSLYGASNNGVDSYALGGPLIEASNMFFTGGPVSFSDMPKRPLILSPDKIATLSPEDKALYQKAWDNYNKEYKEWSAAFDALMQEAELNANEQFQKKQLELNARTPEQIQQMGVNADAKYKIEHPMGGEADPNLEKESNLVVSTLLNQLPFTGLDYQEAVNNLRQKDLDLWGNYKNGINATATLAELGLSGGSLLGAYANYKKWADLANVVNPTKLQLAKASIANFLEAKLLPMQIGGVAIDGYQTYDAANRGDDFNKWWNATSTGLGVLGSVGAADLFRNARLNYPYIDRVLDSTGLILNASDFLKFGYDTYFK